MIDVNDFMIFHDVILMRSQVYVYATIIIIYRYIYIDRSFCIGVFNILRLLCDEYALLTSCCQVPLEPHPRREGA